MSPNKKSVSRKTRSTPSPPARRRMVGRLGWMTAGAALVAVLALAGLLFLQSAQTTQASVRVAPDARVGDAHTFYSPT